MSILINIVVDDDLAEVLASYDQIQILRSDTSTGTFVEITDASTRINLNTQDTLYDYTDPTGDTTKYYQTRYYNSATSVVGTSSTAFQPSVEPQLVENMRVVITLDADIADTDGNTLGEDYVVYFTTTYNPLYVSSRRVELEIGQLIGNVPTDTVNLAIFEASREADTLTFAAISQTTYYNFARSQWVNCRAQQLLLSNTMGTLAKAKALGDLEVQYDTNGVRDVLGRLANCQAQWLPALQAGGISVQRPSTVVKGQYDPDRPPFGRMWVSPADSPKEVPAGNVNYQWPSNPFNTNQPNSRRFRKHFGNR